MERIIFTGATGLIGSGLLELLSKDYECYVVGRCGIDKENILFIQQDLGQDFDIKKFPGEADYIIHLAQADGHNNFPQNAKVIFDVNLRGMVNLLDYGVYAKIKKFLFASSGGIYGSGNEIFSENQDISFSTDLNFYQKTKLCMEILSQSYQQFYDIVTFRIFFGYGEHQKQTMLLPRLIDNISSGKTIKIASVNDIKMNPIYKSDIARCIYEAIKKTDGSHVFNIAGNEIISLGEIVRKISCKLGMEPKIVYEPNMQGNTIADNKKMLEDLWIPQITFDEGLSRILAERAGDKDE